MKALDKLADAYEGPVRLTQQQTDTIIWYYRNTDLPCTQIASVLSEEWGVLILRTRVSTVANEAGVFRIGRRAKK